MISKTLGWNGKATPPLRAGRLIFNTTKWPRVCRQKEAAQYEGAVELWWAVRLTLAQVRRGWPVSYTHSAVFSGSAVATKTTRFWFWPSFSAKLLLIEPIPTGIAGKLGASGEIKDSPESLKVVQFAKCHLLIYYLVSLKSKRSIVWYLAWFTLFILVTYSPWIHE